MISLFCETTLPQWVIGSRRLETTKCPQLQGSIGLTRDFSGLGPVRLLKKRARPYIETSGTEYPLRRRRIPRERNL